MNFNTDTRLKLPLATSAQLMRTVRGSLADRPLYIFFVENFSAEPLVDESHERRTVRATKNLTSLNSANFLNSNFNLGSLLI